MSMAAPYVQVMEDLLKGQEFATQLQGLLRDSPKAGLLTDQILHTFSRAICASKAATAAGEGSEVQSEVTCGRKRKDAAGGGHRRGACRRRTQQSSGVTTTMKNLDDGQAWRKYGQKEIQNSKHPKAYFRCTHKYDQQCAAQRQVQRCDEDPDTFRVTYIGVHTCRDPAAVAPHVIIHQTSDADGLHAGSRLISFAPNASATPATTTSTMTTTTTANTNQAEKDAALGSGLQTLRPEGGDQEEVLSSLTPGSSAVPGAAPAAPAGPDQGDVTSTLQSYGDGLDVGEFFNDCAFGLEDIFDLDS